MKVTYTAKDGKTFQAKEDCRNHEEFIDKKIQIVSDIFVHIFASLLDSYKSLDENCKQELGMMEGNLYSFKVKRLERLKLFVDLLDKGGCFSVFEFKDEDRRDPISIVEEDIHGFFELYAQTLLDIQSEEDIEYAKDNVWKYYDS
jgi:hypothetical protein